MRRERGKEKGTRETEKILGNNVEDTFYLVSGEKGPHPYNVRRDLRRGRKEENVSGLEERPYLLTSE